MDVIYIDSLFALNLLIDYLLLLGGASLCGLPLRRGRFALSALLGALWSVGTVLPGGRVLASAGWKLALSALMACVAYGPGPRFLRSWGGFLLVSTALGGAVWAVSMLGGVPRGNSPWVPVSFRMLFLAFGLSYAALRLLFRRAVEKRERRILALRLTLEERCVEFPALRDTGNELHDPASGRRVCVAEARSLAPLFPELFPELLGSRDPVLVMEALSGLPCCRGRVCLVPYSAVGVEGALLAALRPGALFADGQPLDGVLVALSPTPLSSDGEFSAIL